MANMILMKELKSKDEINKFIGNKTVKNVFMMQLFNYPF